MSLNKKSLSVLVLLLMTTMSFSGAIGAPNFYRDVVPDEAAGEEVPKCTESQDGVAIVTAPAGAAEVTNWVPQCVIIDSGDTVRFINADALPHHPVADECFDAGRISAGAETNVVLSIAGGDVMADVLGDLVPSATACDDTADQARDGRIPFGSVAGSEGPVIEEDDDFYTIHFICAIHGAAMKGVIKIRK